MCGNKIAPFETRTEYKQTKPAWCCELNTNQIFHLLTMPEQRLICLLHVLKWNLEAASQKKN